MAVKALPEDVDHKTEMDLVRLNIGVNDLVATVAGIRSRLGPPGARVLVQEISYNGSPDREKYLDAVRSQPAAAPAR